MDKTLIEDLVWEKVQIARNTKRPTGVKLINYLIEDFIEMHGDRYYADDLAIVGGIGKLNDLVVTIIAEEKGITTEDKIARNFGMPHPEGYRKTLRLIKQAEKFNRPIVLIIDTPGAYPGIGAERRGQALAIANNLKDIASISVPIISIVLGEGGSGGALAIGVSDEIWMLENAIYSILSPEGFASILYKDASFAKQAAAVMKLTANDLLEYKIIDRIIPEVEGGLHLDMDYSFKIIKEELDKVIKSLLKIDKEKLVDFRYNKYRSIGVYEE